MNIKRLSLGAVLISASIFLIVPKPGLEFLNWQNEAFIVLTAVIPLAAIIYGFMWFNDSHENVIPDLNIGRDSEDEVEEPFETELPWNSDGNWDGSGVEIHEGSIEEEFFKIAEGETFSHYMKTFNVSQIDKISINVEVPEPEKSEVWLRVKTSDQPDFEDIKGEKSFELKDGEFEEELDLDWGEFTFFKVLPEREGAEVESPRILNIKLE